jgi:uncharacterized OB-fold protein
MACDSFLHPGARFCTECLSEELDWQQASGAGTLHTFGVMHQRYGTGWDAEIPYNVAIVELAEGPRLTTNIVGCPNADLRVGMALEVAFEKVAEEVYLARFRPAS